MTNPPRKPEKLEPKLDGNDVAFDANSIGYSDGWNDCIEEYDKWIDAAPLEKIVSKKLQCRHGNNCVGCKDLADSIRKLLKG